MVLQRIKETPTSNRSEQAKWWHRLLARQPGARRQPAAPTYRPILEVLEDRTVLATFNVSNATQLIDAINTANGNNQADTINIDPGITITLGAVNNTVNGDNGLPHITSDNGNRLTFNGNDSTIERGTFAPIFRLLSIGGNANVTINNLTFRNGTQIGFAGAIRNFGNLTINDSTFRFNSASEIGGAIVNHGTLTVSDTSFETNISIISGGAIFNFATATIRDSMFTGNEAQNDVGWRHPQSGHPGSDRQSAEQQYGRIKGRRPI